MSGNKGQKRKKKKRIFTVIGTLLLIMILGLGAIYFIERNSEEVRQYQADTKEASEKFTGDLISGIEKTDPSQEPAGITGSGTQVPSGVITACEKQVISQELAKLDDQKKQQILQNLSVSYSRALNAQKAEAFAMVDGLIGQAKSEYAGLVASGQNTAANKGRLAAEYLAKANVMENQMDASFNSLISTMDSQLKAQGIDPSAIIAQYRGEYNRIKEANRSALMQKAAGIMSSS